MPKESLKDKLDGNELDLSLSSISVVPVKELAALPKATRLDLSCNVITSLPDSFCSLTHLIKIDLSKNSLTELPDIFGSLSNLQHLDLLGNQLNLLPVSFCQLHKLKWLDLKGNPLEPELKKVTGDCLDETQCRKCAQQVVAHMTVINSDIEKIRQKKLRKKNALEEARKAKEEEALQKMRLERKAAKQKRKLDQQQAKQSQQKENARVTELGKKEKPQTNGTKSAMSQKKKKNGGWMSCKLLFLSLLALLIGVLLGLYFYCEQNAAVNMCQDYWSPAVKQTVDCIHRVMNYTEKQIGITYRICEPYIHSCCAYAGQVYTATVEFVESLFSSTSKAESSTNQAAG